MKNLFKKKQISEKKEGYIKSSATLVTVLMFIAMALYHITKGYGTMIALVVALIVMAGKKMLMVQTEADFKDMYYSREMYIKTKNKDYLKFIEARSNQMLNDNKVLTQRAKDEISILKEFVSKHQI